MLWNWQWFLVFCVLLILKYTKSSIQKIFICQVEGLTTLALAWLNTMAISALKTLLKLKCFLCTTSFWWHQVGNGLEVRRWLRDLYYYAYTAKCCMHYLAWMLLTFCIYIYECVNRNKNENLSKLRWRKLMNATKENSNFLALLLLRWLHNKRLSSFATHFVDFHTKWRIDAWQTLKKQVTGADNIFHFQQWASCMLFANVTVNKTPTESNKGFLLWRRQRQCLEWQDTEIA